MPDIYADSFSWSVCYALAAPADMYLALAVLRAYEQAVDNGHRNVELVEYLGLLLDVAALDELVQPLLGQHQCHEVLFHGILVSDEMHVLRVTGIQPYETEVVLLHTRYVPLERFENDIVAGRDVYGTAQALLGAYQHAVYRGIETAHDFLPFPERYVPPDNE